MIHLFLLIVFFIFGSITVIAPVAASVILLFLSTIEAQNYSLMSCDLPISVWGQISFLLGCVLRWWITKEEIDWKLGYPALFVTSASLISIPFSINPISAFISVITICSFLLTFYFVAFLVKTTSSRFQLGSIINWIIVFFIIVSAYQLYSTEKWGMVYLHGLFENGSLFGVVLAGWIPILTLELIQTRNIKTKLYSIFFLLLSIGMIIGTQTISGYVLLGSSIVVICFFGFLHRKYLYIFAVLLCLGVFVVVFVEFANLISVREWIDRFVNSTRVQVHAQNMMLAFMAFVENPFTGVGTGQWNSFAMWSYPELPFTIKNNYSSIMMVLSETGLFGLIAYSYLFHTIIVKEQSQNIKDTLLHKSVSASVWIWIIASLIYSIHLHLFTWVWLGMLAGLSSLKESKKSE